MGAGGRKILSSEQPRIDADFTDLFVKICVIRGFCLWGKVVKHDQAEIQGRVHVEPFSGRLSPLAKS
jgi:hypothetical protein